MNRRFFLLLASLGLAIPPAPAADTPPAPLEAYAAVGTSMVRDNRLAQLGWTEAQIEAFVRGVQAGFRGENRPLDPGAQALLNDIGRRMQEMDEAEQKKRFGAEAFAQPGRLAEYLKEMRKQFSLEVTDSGLCYGIKSGGYGSRPGPDDTVVMSYKVNKADIREELPKLTVDRLKIKVADLPPGLAEGLQMMTAGSYAMLLLPPDLSYGTGEWPPGTDRGTPLIYTVKLHEISTPP